MVMNEVIETRNARVWLGDDGIIRCMVNPGSEETLDHAKENVTAVRNLSHGVKRPLLVDMSAQKSATKEAQEYYAGEESIKEYSSVALLVGSPVSKVLGSLFLRLRFTNFPIKLFTSEEDAIEWLNGFIK